MTYNENKEDAKENPENYQKELLTQRYFETSEIETKLIKIFLKN